MAPIVVLGGGLAGGSAALALAEAGLPVILIEKRPRLGGRASSYQPPGWDHAVDNSQHVLLGCCTNLLDFYRRLGVAERIDWHARLTLIDADGRRGVFRAGAGPPPLHLLPGFLALPGLSLRDRWRLGRAFACMLPAGRRLAELGSTTFGEWLGGATTERLDRGFWRLMLTSVLNAGADRVSARYALMFFLDGLMRNRRSFAMGVPQVPLGALHHDALHARLTELGAEVRLSETAAVELDGGGGRVAGVRLRSGVVAAEEVICAVAWTQLEHALGAGVAARVAGGAIGELRAEAIVGVHLAYAEPVLDLPVIGFLDQAVDWVFALDGGRHLSVVVSDAGGLAGVQPEALRDRALAALRRHWPALPDPLRWAACREARATFVPAPGCDAVRPDPPTAIAGLHLAGGWTNTGWPATQESAVRSGHRAAEAVLERLGMGREVLRPDLPAEGLMRWFRPAEELTRAPGSSA